MQGFLDSLRIELRETGVDVSVISPGFVKTDIRSKVLGPDGRARETSPRDESVEMSVEEPAMRPSSCGPSTREKREVVSDAAARYGRWLKLIAPGAV